jgi:hypothetical protein
MLFVACHHYEKRHNSRRAKGTHCRLRCRFHRCVLWVSDALLFVALRKRFWKMALGLTKTWHFGLREWNLTPDHSLCFTEQVALLCFLWNTESHGNAVFIGRTLTPWSRGLLEKLTVSQLVKKFPAFYRTRRFITAFTRARHLSLSGATHNLKKSYIIQKVNKDIWQFQNPMLRFYVEYSLVLYRTTKEQLPSTQLLFDLCPINYCSGNMFRPLLVNFRPSQKAKTQLIS